MKRAIARRKLLASVAALVSLVFIATTAGATQVAVDPALVLEGPGLTIAEAGIGLEGLGSGTRTLTIDIGGPVEKAILYWAGRDHSDCDAGVCFQPPNTPPFGDQELVFAGGAVTGAIVGTEDANSGNIAYAADVTTLVQAAGTGTQSFTIADGNLTNNLDPLNGAGLIVVYTDASDANTYRVTIADGLDFAYAGLGVTLPSIPENQVTSPVTFSFASSDAARTGQLTLFVADAVAGRPDRVDISNNPSLVNSLNGSDGAQWDTDTHTIAIPASSSQTTVQLFSAPTAPRNRPQPDSLLWVVAALRVPLPPEETTTTTSTTTTSTTTTTTTSPTTTTEPEETTTTTTRPVGSTTTTTTQPQQTTTTTQPEETTTTTQPEATTTTATGPTVLPTIITNPDGPNGPDATLQPRRPTQPAAQTLPFTGGAPLAYLIAAGLLMTTGGGVLFLSTRRRSRT